MLRYDRIALVITTSLCALSLAGAQVTENAVPPAPPTEGTKPAAVETPPKPAKPKLPDAATARKQIQAIYNEVNALVKKQEYYAVKQHILQHTTEDFIHKEKGGKKLSREDSAEMSERAIFGVSKFTTVVSRITSLAIKGSDVIVVFADTTAFLVPGGGGSSRRVSVSSTNRDTWVKTEEGWKTRLSETLTSKTLVNGKPPQVARRKPGRRGGGNSAEPDDMIDAITSWSLGR
jgi:hypothetical protein